MPHYLMFDIESLGLHGLGFAAGAIIANEKGQILELFELMANEGEKELSVLALTVPFFAEMQPKLSDIPRCETIKELRDTFFGFYMDAKSKYKDLQVWSDCNFPVETNFLSEIVKDGKGSRDWQMPFPLRDLSTLLDINIDRVNTSPIKGLRPHNPLDDSKASLWHLMKIKHGLDKPFNFR